ncbi:CDP-glycerol glycerophosphotransferase family protein [uncultured Jatrophihabitans sp.]|uniref:CDP-glycerol glycerophosphotransferase family protein n=1 Tax=uncultured Jatrophihabitans sp. TaxID=1610747 RepID=UPI0035CCA5FB
MPLKKIARRAVRQARSTVLHVRQRGVGLAGHGLIAQLAVEQRDDVLDIEFLPGSEVTPHAVWARYAEDLPDAGRPERGWTQLPGLRSDAGTYRLTVALADLPAKPFDDAAVLMLYVEVDAVLGAADEERLELTGRHDVVRTRVADGVVRVRYRPPLGVADITRLGRLHEIEARGRRLRPHVVVGGALAVAVDHDVLQYGRVEVSRLTVRHGVVQLRGWLSTRHNDVLTGELLLKGRTTDYRAATPLRLTPDAHRIATRWGMRWYRIAADLDCAPLLDDPAFADDTFDAYVSLQPAQERQPFEVRVGRTRFVKRVLTNAGWAHRGDAALAINPYYTFVAKRTSFRLARFDGDVEMYLRRAVRTRHVDRVRHSLRHGRKDVWLIGEQPYKAQDNGYRFFQHLREQHPDVEAYYVIDPNSPERRNVEPYGNVVAHKSREHVRVSLLATKIAGTHHAEYLFPMRTRSFDKKVRGARIFLQHGVMGAKWSADVYRRSADFDTDMFVVSSEPERRLIVRDFGFDYDDVAVTGLARFDALFNDDVERNPRQVLVIPTWRFNLYDIDRYAASDFHRAWHRFLTSKRLRTLVDRHDLELVFALHPNMRQYRHLFADVPARIVQQGEVDVQYLLKRSAMLITDYSSVGWDFSFLGKPVIYYQFDRDDLLPPHVDPDLDLPGPVRLHLNGLLAELTARARDDFAMPEKYRERSQRFLAHHDRENSERIFRAGSALRRHRDVKQAVLDNEVVRLGWRVFRRSGRYLPAMRRLYPLLRLLPVDDNLVFFESGMGKQYADSPRRIYEELLRRELPLRKVWSFVTPTPLPDRDTKTVERHSLAYYYYLARARYWVSDQSFPYYVTRRPDGIYVQTWHGTPLKRMLHDLDSVHGRDNGYAYRATTAAAQWGTLVSPSPFTTQALRSAFRYTGDVLEVGYPRNDVLQGPGAAEIGERVRRRLGIRPEQRVVLYAPTFRDDQTMAPGQFTFALPFDLDKLYQQLGGEAGDTVLLLRMHVHVRNKLEVPEHLRGFARDVSRHPDIQELYLAADVLVTDYSSVFFDYATLRRPIVFYAYDLAAYRDVLRGFYLDYDTELPGPIVTTQDDLADTLNHLDEVDAPFQARRDEFLDRFAPRDDGHATERVVDAIFGPAPPLP